MARKGLNPELVQIIDHAGRFIPSSVETFSNQNYGMWNVSKALEFIRMAPDCVELAECPISIDIFKWLTKTVDLDVEHLKRIEKKRSWDDPLLAIEVDDQPMLIDGHHRLMVRIKRQYTRFSFWVIPHRLADYFRIYVRIRTTPNCPWRLMTNDEILGATIGTYTRPPK